jgi:hypothetical protein
MLYDMQSSVLYSIAVIPLYYELQIATSLSFLFIPYK